MFPMRCEKSLKGYQKIRFDNDGGYYKAYIGV